MLGVLIAHNRFLGPTGEYSDSVETKRLANSITPSEETRDFERLISTPSPFMTDR